MKVKLDPYAFRLSRELAGEVGLKGLARGRAVQIVRDLAYPLIDGFYNDQGWVAINQIFAALNTAGIHYDLKRADCLENDGRNLP